MPPLTRVSRAGEWVIARGADVKRAETPLSVLMSVGPIMLAVVLWPPDWSQFLPDLINALATGGVLAAVVWILQVRRENAAARDRASDGWRRLRVWLRPHFAGTLPRYREHYYSELPDLSLRKTLLEFPVEDWSRALPDHEALRAVITLQQEWPRMLEAERRVRGLLPSSIQRFMPLSSPVTELQDWMVIVVMNHLGGADLNERGARAGLAQYGVSAELVDQWQAATIVSQPLQTAIEESDGSFAIVRGAYALLAAAV